MMFIGGCADGENIEVAKVGNRYPPVFYLVVRMTFEAARELHVDDHIMWKSPEDVYYLRDGAYHYDRTVHYNPQEGE